MQVLADWEPKKYGGSFSEESCVTLVYSELGAYLEPFSNIYNTEFYSELCVNLAYLKPWHI